MSDSPLTIQRVAVAAHPQLPEAFVEAEEIAAFWARAEYKRFSVPYTMMLYATR